MKKDKLEYIKSNINKINLTNFKLNKKGVELFGSITNLKRDLSIHFNKRIEKKEFKKQLINEFVKLKCIRTKIELIANDNLIRKVDLEKFFDLQIQNEVIKNIDREDYIINVLKFIENNSDFYKYNYVKNSIKKLVLKQFNFIGSNGFPSNILNINAGVMTSNAGDSAQFLFIARAILAGYNCSNVDVRSSRYDAVIDFNNKLLRVQVKGVSSNSVSFKDRDRGGQGIDHKHERNKGKRITSKDCDIYVAVDKKVGTCYIIPMALEIDPMKESEITNVNLKNLEKYKENWSTINKLTVN